MLEKQKITLKSSTDDLMLYADLYIPDDPKAVVQIIHGMAEHKERYETLANILATYGCVVLVADNRGHGESINENIPLGYFADKNGWLVNLQDLHNFSMDIMEKYPTLPFYVIGHSMGSLIAHSFIKRYEDMVSGVIFSGMPAYNSATGSAKMLAGCLSNGKGAKKTSKILTGASDFNKEYKHPRTSFDWLSYNVDNVDAYIADPLCGFPFTNRGYYDLLDGMQDVFARNDWRVLKKQLPILFIVGQDDPCADVATGFKKSLNNLSKVGYEKIEAIIYQNMRHEIFNEREKKTVFRDVLTWFNKQIMLSKENQ